MDKKLYRDPRNGMIAGVCAGVAEYFGWDPTWVRLGWALRSEEHTSELQSRI